MELDALIQGVAHGTVASKMLAANGDPRALRPYLDWDSDSKSWKSFVSIHVQDKDSGEWKEKAVQIHTPALLRKDEWIALDTTVENEAMANMPLVQDMMSRGLSYTVGVGMGATQLLTQKASEMKDAAIGMTGLEGQDNETPQFEQDTLPLPIIHKTVNIPLRMLITSRQGGMPLDTIDAEQAGRIIGEAAEKLYCGTLGNYTFGGTKIYGLTNHPNRIPYELHDWRTASGSDIQADLLGMFTALRLQRKTGPYLLQISPDFMDGLQRDYSVYTADSILTRLMKTQNLAGITASDAFEDCTACLIDAKKSSIRIVEAMSPQNVQWEEKGGWMLFLKALLIRVPEIRKTFAGRIGVVHGSYGDACSSN